MGSCQGEGSAGGGSWRWGDRSDRRSEEGEGGFMYLGGVRSKGSGGDAGRWARILHKPQRSRSPLCSGVSWEDNNNPPACTAACTPARRPHPAAPPPGRDHRDPPNIPPATSSAKQPPNFLHRSRPSALFLPKPKAFWWRGNPPAPARRVRKSPSPPAEGVGARWDPPPSAAFIVHSPVETKGLQSFG